MFSQHFDINTSINFDMNIYKYSHKLTLPDDNRLQSVSRWQSLLVKIYEYRLEGQNTHREGDDI